MLTRRALLSTTAATIAAPAVITGAHAATPKGVVVMAKQIDDIAVGFDPAESYEATNNETDGNCYRKLVMPDPSDPNRLVGDLAESWDVSKDGMSFSFKTRANSVFESGKPVTAEDVAFSIQRVVKLNKTPGFIFTQFGFTADNVEKMVRATGERTLELKLPELQASSFVLYCLSANVGCVVEKATALANQTNGDLGNDWLKRHTAGSGPYRLVEWLASDRVTLDANPHATAKPKIPRVVLRHIAEPAAQLLELQKGGVDIARDLGPDQLKSIAGKPDFQVLRANQLTSLYAVMNMSLPQFQKREVLQAVKWAIDYDSIAKNIAPIVYKVWQSFLPDGTPGAISETPYKRDVAKAKALLAQAGYPDGFTVTLDHFSTSPERDIAQAIQANLATIGVKVELLAGERKQVITKTRARQHQMALLSWFSDYLDPNSNAQGFCANPDDSDASKLRILAWRSHYADKDITELVAQAAKELDGKKRLDMYARMQRDFMQRSPFAMLLQKAEVAAVRKGVSGLTLGTLPDYTRYAQITKA
jgi:peptide/nickel transport system substrate-binding protein